MLGNFNNVRKAKNVSLVDIADLLNVRYQTIADKISGESSFKFTEALKIQEKFFPEYEIKFLFRPTNQTQSLNKRDSHEKSKS